MLKYIYRDMISKLRYLPYGVVIGVPVAALLLFIVNRVRRHGGKEPTAALPIVVFGIYLAVILIITLLCREGGSSNGGIDLKLFSTWGINRRNNAYVVENVMLFLPYGFFSCWAFERLRRFFACALLGTATSVGIECLQLATGRGFFQIDDIVTNVLGMVLGFVGYRILTFRKR